MHVTVINNSSRQIKVSTPQQMRACYLRTGSKTVFDVDAEEDFTIATIVKTKAYYCGEGEHTLTVRVEDGSGQAETDLLNKAAIEFLKTVDRNEWAVES